MNMDFSHMVVKTTWEKKGRECTDDVSEDDDLGNA